MKAAIVTFSLATLTLYAISINNCNLVSCQMFLSRQHGKIYDARGRGALLPGNVVRPFAVI